MTEGTAAEQRASVVIVEDQQAIAELLCDVLSEAGFKPTWAQSAHDAARVAREAQADVVLLDVMMPERSGWMVLEELRSNPVTRDTPVVIISAVYDRPGLHPLPEGGPIRFAAKPFDIVDLIETVSSLTG
ncbi:MAG TPA: response regulator [Thermomicrobiales bacterium]